MLASKSVTQPVGQLVRSVSKDQVTQAEGHVPLSLSRLLCPNSQSLNFS